MTTWSISATWATSLSSAHSISKTDCLKHLQSTTSTIKHRWSWHEILGNAATGQNMNTQSYKTWLSRGSTKTKI
jgi:hypothetical protein